jgi:NAD(P)-dependent dehydrogenase (short-subunit alcohol dehydrogenase family)
VKPVALITGASRGIGRGIALELAKLGHNLVINFASNESAARRTSADCVATAKKAGHAIRAQICQADVGESADRRKLIEFTRSTFGRLDVLVNNAGVAPIVREDLLHATEESFDRLMRLNAKAPCFLTQLAANWMIEQVKACASSSKASDSAQDGDGPRGSGAYQPRIVIISSVSAYTASVNRGDYCISKAALSMITSLFAVRLAEYGIGVYEIRPGLIATDMTVPVKEKYDRLIAEGLTPIQRWGTPEDIGRAVSAIAQGLLPFSTGEVINVDGGFHLRRL